MFVIADRKKQRCQTIMSCLYDNGFKKILQLKVHNSHLLYSFPCQFLDIVFSNSGTLNTTTNKLLQISRVVPCTNSAWNECPFNVWKEEQNSFCHSDTVCACRKLPRWYFWLITKPEECLKCVICTQQNRKESHKHKVSTKPDFIFQQIWFNKHIRTATFN